MRNYMLAAAISSTGYFTAAQIVSAETSLGIYPPLTRIDALPGALVKTPIVLVNNSSSDVLISIKILGFKASYENNGSVEHYIGGTAPSELDSFLNKVTIYDGENQIKSLKLYPKEYKNLVLEFKTPEEERDYYFSVVFATDSKTQKEEDTIINIVNGASSHVLLSVGALKQPTVRISEMSTPRVSLGGKQSFKIEIDNTSPNYISAAGTLSLYNIFGQKVGEVKLTPGILLSNSQRYMTDSSGKQTQSVMWNEKLTFGFYTAKAVIQINNAQSISKETTFVSIPLLFLLAITVLLFIVLSVLYRVIKKIHFKTP